MSRVWGKRFAAAAGLWFSALVFDTVLNDDVDIVFKDPLFRTRKTNLTPEERSKLPKVVILGTGWGALSMIRKLHVDEFQVTVVSPRNYFLFTPLLASTTVGTLHQRSIVEPIRQFFNRSGAQLADFLEAECTDIDFDKQRLTCKSATKPEIPGFDLEYDHLVIAVGAQSATFGIPGVAEHALFMKEINQSYVIRDKILDCLETANLPGLSREEQDRLLSFVVVGGGPSGIEFSAELHDFLKRDIYKNYPQYANRVKLMLVEALPHVLTMFDASLIQKVEDQFRNELQIDLLLNCQVKSVGEKSLDVLNQNKEMIKVPYGALVWVTGNTPRPLIRDCMVKLKDYQKDRRGLVVDGHFRVLGTKNCYAIGDCAISKFPPTAQVAYQEGTFLARAFNRLLEDGSGAESGKEFSERLEKLPEFKYRHFGSFAYIGDHSAIAQIPRDERDKHDLKLDGFVTFFLWRSVYFSKLLSYKNRFMVGTDWLKTYFFGRDVSRG